MQSWVFLIMAIPLAGLGFFLTTFVEKRKFMRRNAAGLEEFNGYWQALFSSWGEGTISLLGRVCFAIAFLFGTVFIIGHISSNVTRYVTHREI